MITIYGLKNCDATRTALRAHPGAMLRDVRETPLTAKDIERFLQYFGPTLINQRSTTWRELGAEDRALPPASLLMRYPALMKRPVIEIDGALQPRQ